ncbi:MAG: tRNA 2-thiouridine(34) synthase MnmA [bacterium]|nr:tRNA 2-thiouridine(34) synthase MnmA [bacterium]
MRKKKVFVGLSGGVDSSVSAALLKEAGYDVIGVFIKVWQPDWMKCTTTEDRRDAMRVCAHIEIPFLEFNAEKIYKKSVVDYMVDEYGKGRTPNPDVMCNAYVKFGVFYEWAIQNGADFVATGHYARIMEHGTRNMEQKKTGNLANQMLHVTSYTLHESSDSQKDQSYFLWQIKKEQLPHIMFPVGNMEKTEVRKLARKFGLPTAQKKDSQGLCFIGKVDMKEFLGRYAKAKSGKVLNEKGEEIGIHDGAIFFTLGQRHGFKINTGKAQAKRTEDSSRMYVVSKNMKKNTITVSSRTNAHKGEISNADRQEVFLSSVNWLSEKLPQEGETFKTRFRYREELSDCVITAFNRKQKTLRLKLEENGRYPTVGQSAVIYSGRKLELMGGGIIDMP